MRKSIFIVVDSLNLGGSERQCLLLSKELKKEWDPILVTFSDGLLSEDYRKAGIPVFFISRSSRFDFLSPMAKLSKLIIKLKPLLLHSWGWMSAISSSVLSSLHGMTHINSTIRMGTMPSETKVLSKIGARLGTWSVANSQAGLKAWKVPQGKGVVVCNGFDSNRINSPILENTLIPDDFRITMIASMSKYKDWNAFILTADIMDLTKNNISFHGFGDGINREQILVSASKLINRKLLFLPGRTTNPIAECKKTNLGVLFSTKGEGISNSLMEFMACAKPVICSNSGGNPELVIDGVTGFLVDPKNDPQEISEKILWLKENPDKCIAMGNAGKDRLLNKFSTEQMVRKYQSLYIQALSN